jgi:hypothetical protein
VRDDLGQALRMRIIADLLYAAGNRGLPSDELVRQVDLVTTVLRQLRDNDNATVSSVFHGYLAGHFLVTVEDDHVHFITREQTA